MYKETGNFNGNWKLNVCLCVNDASVLCSCASVCVSKLEEQQSERQQHKQV